MTDKYGDNDHMQQEDGLQDLGTQAETWQEDQPPVDDFGDSDVDDTSDVEEDVAGADEAPRKGSMLVPVVAALVCVAFVGTMFYVQFGSQLENKTPIQATELLKEEGVDKVEQKKPIEDGSKTTDSGYSDINSLYPPSGQADSSAGVGNAVSTTVSNISTEPLTSVAETAPVAPSSQSNVALVPPPAPSALPSAEPVPAPAPVKAAAVVPPAPAAVSPAAAPASSPAVDAKLRGLADATAQAVQESKAQEAKMSELVTRIDALQKMLEQTTQQMSQMVGTVANIQAASAQAVVSSSEKETARSSVKKEAQSVAPMEAAVEDESKSTALSDKDALIKASADEKVSATKDSEDKSKDVKKSIKKTKKSSSIQAKKSKTTMTNKSWVLRAATPETAWVSKGADSSELRQVEIGKDLPGIGKVKAIRQSENGWEIVGTKGTLR